MEGEELFSSLKSLRQKINETLPTDEKRIVFKKIMEKYSSRLKDAEIRIVPRYKDYEDTEKEFTQDLKDSNYDGEPISYNGLNFKRYTETLIREIVLLIDIMAESTVEVIESLFDAENMEEVIQESSSNEDIMKSLNAISDIEESEVTTNEEELQNKFDELLGIEKEEK